MDGCGMGEMADDWSLGLNLVSWFMSPNNCEVSTLPKSSVSHESSRPEDGAADDGAADDGDDTTSLCGLPLLVAFVLGSGDIP